jgi:hypothetical protein
MTSFKSSLAIEVKLDNEKGDTNSNGSFTGQIFHRFTSIFTKNNSFFGRLMNSLLKVFRRKPSTESHLVNTGAIAAAFTNSSMQIKSFAATLRDKGSRDTGGFSNLYDLSAENMESVSTMLDSIVDGMRSGEATLDSVNCNLMQLLTLIRDNTIPNIEYIADTLFTQSGDVEMYDTFNTYLANKPNQNVSMLTTNNNGDKCLVSSTVPSSVRLFSTTTTDGIRHRSVQELVAIVAYIIFAAIWLVVSLVTIIPYFLFSLVSGGCEICTLSDEGNNNGQQCFVCLILEFLSLPSLLILTFVRYSRIWSTLLRERIDYDN